MSNPAEWLQLERLYHAALDRTPGERAAFVKQACAHDEGLRRELESLLAHDQPDDSFFDHAAIETAARTLNEPEPASVETGGTVGAYKILDLIARGGMGVVYRAEQQYPVRRTVALKIIKPGMDSENVIARFQAERQALALMDHPNIARVLDAGTTSAGRLYFVMEFVDGLPVTEYCRKHDLDLGERLSLFIPICHAIQHAHQKGILHRDIKPSNVLVPVYDGKPVPKVIDFGIAKALQEPLHEGSMHTQAGVVMGTLEYMSPEQAGSCLEDIDTRSDVYSLGAVLYEVIAGSSPLNRASLENLGDPDIVRRIREEDPPPPSKRLGNATLSRAVHGDLDWVVMKALAKDRVLRYATVNGLARDLQRYLAAEPVEAAPPSVSYRMRKFAGRHRAGLMTAAAFTALLVTGVVVSTRMAIRALRAEQEASAVNNFLENDLLAQASPASTPDRDLKVRAALDRAAGGIAGKFDRQPNVEAAIRGTIGQTYADLGLYPEARKQLVRALDLERRVLGPENPQTLKTMGRLAVTAHLEGKNTEAEALLERTLDIDRRVFGPEYSGTLQSMDDLAIVYEAQGKYSEAEDLHRQALEIRRRTLGPEHPATLQSMNGLANTYYWTGRFAKAAALHRQTLEIRRRVLGPEHPDTLDSMNALAVACSRQGKFAEAETLYRQTLQIQRRVLGPEHPNTLHIMSNLAIVESWLGQYAEAEALYRQTLVIARRVLGPEHRYTIESMAGLADTCCWQGKYAEAETLLKQALEIRRRVLGPRHASTLAALSDLGDMYQRQGKYALAEAYASESLAGRRHTLGPQHPDTMNSAAALALAYVSQGKFLESEPVAREAAGTGREKRPDSWQRFRAESVLGASLAGEEKFREAEPLLLAGYGGMEARKEQMQVPNRYYLDRARESIVHFYRAWGKPEKAAEWSRKRD